MEDIEVWWSQLSALAVLLPMVASGDCRMVTATYLRLPCSG